MSTDLIGQYGFPVFVAVMLLIYTYKQQSRRDAESAEREKRMADKMDASEEWQKNTLVRVITKNTDATDASARASSGLRRVLQARPCLHDEDLATDELIAEEAQAKLKEQRA